MAQKKNETAAAVEETINSAEVPTSSGFVNTFWDQFELSRERALKLRENREDAYLNAVKEVIKFNKQFRKTVAQLYEQTKKTNQETISEVMQQINSKRDEAKGEAAVSKNREELKKQVKEVSGQLEKLALTPVKSFLQVVNQLEDTFEKNTESSIAFSRESRKTWLELRKEYIKFARNTHLNLVERGKSSVKELVKTR